MQSSLFDQNNAEVDVDRDPYADVHEAAARIVSEYAVDHGEAFDTVLAFGSEDAALRALRQRWWNGQVELREREAA